MIYFRSFSRFKPFVETLVIKNEDLSFDFGDDPNEDASKPNMASRAEGLKKPEEIEEMRVDTFVCGICEGRSIYNFVVRKRDLKDQALT